MPYPRPIPTALCLLVVLAMSAGCSPFITPHQTYAPLLDHAGQLDVMARAAGAVAGVQGLLGVDAAVAYAPIDHLEVLVGGDLLFSGPASRYGGQLGVGVFARDDVLRLEGIVGVFGGTARGRGEQEEGDGYFLNGPYVQPYAQLYLGYERERFELAGGLRVSGFFSDVTVTPRGTAPPLSAVSVGYERAMLEPSITTRFLFGWFRIDLSVGVSINIPGDRFPGQPKVAIPDDAMLIDSLFQAYLAIGVGFQLDLLTPPARATPAVVYPPYATPYAPAE